MESFATHFSKQPLRADGRPSQSAGDKEEPDKINGSVVFLRTGNGSRDPKWFAAIGGWCIHAVPVTI